MIDGDDHYVSFVARHEKVLRIVLSRDEYDALPDDYYDAYKRCQQIEEQRALKLYLERLTYDLRKDYSHIDTKVVQKRVYADLDTTLAEETIDQAQEVCCVYALRNELGTFYIGATRNLKKRLSWHVIDAVNDRRDKCRAVPELRRLLRTEFGLRYDVIETFATDDYDFALQREAQAIACTPGVVNFRRNAGK